MPLHLLKQLVTPFLKNMNLNSLIDKIGKSPLFIIDNWSSEKFGYACFDFEETILFNENGIFINNEKYKNKDIQEIQNTIDLWKKDSKNIAALGFASYHFKDILYPNIKFSKSSKFPYLFFAKPKNIYKYEIKKQKIEQSNVEFNIMKDIIDVNKYVEKIDEIKKELENGNAYQINYTMNKKYKLNCNPLDLFLKIREKAEPQFGYYLNFNEYDILSFSPEQFFKTKSKFIYSYPMKGTIQRSLDIKKDQYYKSILEKSSKDKAEHLMIVDLIRNDIGKISKFGTVETNNLFKVESYKTVHQMVTEISGELIDGIKEFDILKALFPGGSITGAPKESAMKIIDKIENYNRNIYTGTIGYIKKNGDMNFNIPIRTMCVKNNIGNYPVGGGIIWDSIAENEWNEAQLKSKILK